MSEIKNDSKILHPPMGGVHSGGKIKEEKNVKKVKGPQTVHLDKMEAAEGAGKNTQVKDLKKLKSDQPELMGPAKKEISLEKIKREMTQVSEVNPWMANPSFLGAFLSKFMDLLNTVRDTRFNESQMKMNVETKTFALRMQAADLAKKIKDTEAKKQFLDAAKSLISAGISTYQFKKMVEVKGQTHNEMEKNAMGKNIAKQEAELKKMKKEFAQENKNSIVVGENNNLNKQPELTKEQAKQIQAKEKELRKARSTFESTKQSTMNREVELIRQKSQIFSELTNSCFGVLSGLYTQQTGALEKDRGRTEALIDMFSKMLEGINEARRDLASQFDKAQQLMTQTSSETMRAHAQKG